MQNNITEKRPATSTDEAYTDLKKFIGFLKGDPEESKNGDKITVPYSVSEYIGEKIKSISPIKMLARVTYTDFEKLDVVMDRADFKQSGWIIDNKPADDQESNICKKSIELHELFARPKVTQRLMDDKAIRIEDFIKEKIVSQMAYAENRAFLFGDGISQPKGILKYDLYYEEKTEENKIAAVKTGEKGKITEYDQLVKVMEKLPSEYLCNAVWIMSRNAASTIRQLRDGTTNRFIWQNSIAHGIPNTLLGYPVIICDDMPKLSEKDPTTPVLFGNFYEAYQIAERQDISLLKDPYNSKPFIEFYATKRIGGDVVNFDAIVALRCEE
ncbi:MAG: phage major capsid protein [Holosporales bacterium]|jgi:HK97 family phage major capsid protein|nr:phage major capsid protein [Holosporales bacterium]